jgi:hypothetical protein
MKKIKMSPLWISNFFNFKGTKKHVFEKNQDQIYQTFTNSNNVAKLDLRNFFLNDPIAFLHKKLEDCYIIFSPYYIKFSKGKFKKKDITSLHKKLQELGLAYRGQQRYIQRQLNFFKLINEKNTNPANLNNIRKIEEKIAESNSCNKEDIDKILDEIRSYFISAFKTHEDITLYAYAIGKNRYDKEYVIPNEIKIKFFPFPEHYSLQSPNEAAISFKFQVKNSTFLGIDELTDGFKEVIENESSLKSFNEAFYFIIRRHYFDKIDGNEEASLDKYIEDQKYDRLSIQKKAICYIYKTFFDPYDCPNSYSFAVKEHIQAICMIGPLSEEYFSYSNSFLEGWFIEFFNEFLTENKRQLIKEKCLLESHTIDSKFLFELKTELNSYLNFITQTKFNLLSTIFSNYNLSYLETPFQKRVATCIVQNEIGNLKNYNESTDFDDLYRNLKLENRTEFKRWQDFPEIPEHLHLF